MLLSSAIEVGISDYEYENISSSLLNIIILAFAFVDSKWNSFLFVERCFDLNRAKHAHKRQSLKRSLKGINIRLPDVHAAHMSVHCAFKAQTAGVR